MLTSLAANLRERLSRWPRIRRTVGAARRLIIAPWTQFKRRLWRSANERDGVEVLHFARRRVLSPHATGGMSPSAAKDHFAAIQRDWTLQDEKVVVARGDILIEPNNSLPILGSNALLTQAQGVHPEILPPVRARLLSNRLRAGAEELDTIVHFDGFLGLNAWHFFDDAFNPLMMMLDRGLVLPGTPVLIHRKVWTSPMTRFFLKHPVVKDLDWRIQDKQWLRAREVIKAERNVPYFKAAHEYARTVVNGSPSRRIFLDRRRRYGRNIYNLQDIEAVTRRFGFETVYAEDLPFEAQVELFASAQAVVGVHGAGLVNLLFADVPKVRCLEIHTGSYMMPHYHWMLDVLGVEKYDAMVGSPLLPDQSFAVDPKELEIRLEEMS